VKGLGHGRKETNKKEKRDVINETWIICWAIKEYLQGSVWMGSSYSLLPLLLCSFEVKYHKEEEVGYCYSLPQQDRQG